MYVPSPRSVSLVRTSAGCELVLEAFPRIVTVKLSPPICRRLPPLRALGEHVSGAVRGEGTGRCRTVMSDDGELRQRADNRLREARARHARTQGWSSPGGVAVSALRVAARAGRAGRLLAPRRGPGRALPRRWDGRLILRRPRLAVGLLLLFALGALFGDDLAELVSLWFFSASAAVARPLLCEVLGLWILEARRKPPWPGGQVKYFPLSVPSFLPTFSSCAPTQ